MTDRIAELIRQVSVEKDAKRQFDLMQTLYMLLAEERQRGIKPFEPALSRSSAQSFC